MSFPSVFRALRLGKAAIASSHPRNLVYVSSCVIILLTICAVSGCGGHAASPPPATDVTEQPAATSEAAGETQPSATAEPPVAQAAPAVQSAPVAQAAPVVQPPQAAVESPPAAMQPTIAQMTTPQQAPPAMNEYLLQVGDEVGIRVVDQPEFSGNYRVRPDGKLTAPGCGDVTAAGRSMSDLREAIRLELARLLRYPDVSVILTDFAKQVIYTFGEVNVPGPNPFVAQMTALHAVAGAGGPTETAKMSSVLVLRRSGPSDVDVFRVDLEAPVDGDASATDVFLQPFDVIYVPRNFIGEVNVFVDHWIRQNIAPFTLYIEGWRAFNTDKLRTVVR